MSLRANTSWKEGFRPSASSILSSFRVPPQLPFTRNHQFCGREDIIYTIHSAFNQIPPSESGATDAQPMTRRAVVLYGLGGVGKSSIALEYSFQYSKSYTAVFWLDVTSEATMLRTARGIAENLVAFYARQGVSYGEISSFLRLGGLLDQNGRVVAGETDERRFAGAIREWLGMENNGRWLLVLDNYDDIDAVDIQDILPTCDAGHVIITSRRSHLQALGKAVEVDEIDERSAVLLFLKSANKEEVSAGGKYASQLLSK